MVLSPLVCPTVQMLWGQNTASLAAALRGHRPTADGEHNCMESGFRPLAEALTGVSTTAAKITPLCLDV